MKKLLVKYQKIGIIEGYELFRKIKAIKSSIPKWRRPKYRQISTKTIDTLDTDKKEVKSRLEKLDSRVTDKESYLRAMTP